jgi:GTP pyrophosphokinase
MVEFLTGIRIRGQDSKGLMMKMIRAISDQSNLNIRSITIDTQNGGFDGVFKLYVHNTHEVDRLIVNLKKIDGVHTVYRIQD